MVKSACIAEGCFIVFVDGQDEQTLHTVWNNSNLPYSDVFNDVIRKGISISWSELQEKRSNNELEG